MHEVLDDLGRRLRKDDCDAALCIVVSTSGSTPLKAGATMLVRSDGITEGSIGGGALELAVVSQAREAIASNSTSLVEHRLVRDHNMCCGGSVQVFIKPIMRPDKLYLFGAGHVGLALARASAPLGFDITVVDERAEILERWPRDLGRQLTANPRDVMPTLEWDERVFAVIATHSHPLDREVLAACLARPHAYCGMIGSQRKVAITRMLFLDQCWATPEQLDCVDMPMGIDIGAESAVEIAVSIAARLIEVRRNRRAPATEAQASRDCHDAGTAAPADDLIACVDEMIATSRVANHTIIPPAR